MKSCMYYSSSLSTRSHRERSPAGAGEGGSEEMSVRELHRKHTPGGHLQTTQVRLVGISNTKQIQTTVTETLITGKMILCIYFVFAGQK